MPFDKHFRILNENKTITIVGEILIDEISDEETQETYQLFGGSSANIAVNCTQIGIHSAFFGTVGNDKFGSFLINTLLHEHVDNNITVLPFPTSIVYLNKNQLSPLPYFSRSVDYRIEFSDVLRIKILSSKILHFSFWPLSKEPGRDTILKAIDFAIQNKVSIGFDPNYHPLLDDENQSGLEIIKKVMKKVDIIKPSLDDSKRIFGKECSPEEYLDLYEQLGAKLIIITLGERGLIARYEHETITLPSYATKIVDSTGAGDAFWSGLYAGISNNETIFDSIRLGLVVSSLNLQVIGANCNLPRYEELKKLLNAR